MAIAPEVFARFYAAVNVEWPQFGLSAEEAETQEKRWRRAFGEFDTPSLTYALDEWLKRSKKRPHVSDLMELAIAHTRGRFKGGRAPEAHWTRCSCGCGGQRWLLLLRDRETNRVRIYPATVGELTAAVPSFLTRIPEVVDTLEALCATPMTRVMQECLRAGANRQPPAVHRVGFDDGEVPVYDLPRHTGR